MLNILHSNILITEIRCLKVLISLRELWNDSGTFKKQEDSNSTDHSQGECRPDLESGQICYKIFTSLNSIFRYISQIVEKCSISRCWKILYKIRKSGTGHARVPKI